MKLSKKARTAFEEVIQVDHYEMVAMLRHLGFEFPRRQYAFVSEAIAEDFYEDSINESVYTYPQSEELLAAINEIKNHGINIDHKNWLYCLDEVKAMYGVGPSDLANFTAEELPSGRLKITRND
jgi:hypothetical protein